MSEFSQLPLLLPYRQTLERADFFVSPCNAQAVSWIDRYPQWPGHALLICGEAGCGKTHLGSLFSTCRLNADSLLETMDWSILGEKVVLENLERLKSEEALFHFFNWTQEQNIFVLMTARFLPNFKLPDLRTRIGSVPKVFIDYPDDALLRSVLSKSFSERHILVDKSIYNYILTHAYRSFEKIHQLVKLIDVLSLSAKKPVTIPIVKAAIERLNQ